jgi:hypothetical protein
VKTLPLGEDWKIWNSTASMFLRSTNRKKRVTGDKTVQRTVLYLGEINDSPTVGMAQNEKTPILQVFQEGISETDLPADSNQLILFDL